MRRHRKKATAHAVLAGFSVARGAYLTVHFDDDGPFGCGRRGVVVAAIGPKWITLVSPVKLCLHRVTPRELRRGQPQRTSVTPREAANLIQIRVMLNRRLGIKTRYPAKAVSEIVRRLAT